MENERSSNTLEWELSKENVQPLRQGRKVASLTAALQPPTGDQKSKIKDQRGAFELELRTYDGDDPLDVWYRYIKWTEENYPKGGKDGQLSILLEKCVVAFKDHEQYKNDQRYLEAWVKFANQSTQPLEAYTFLYDQGIGCELAYFFEAWTWALEQAGDTKRADALYQLGINRGAQPVDSLQRAYREFQARTVRLATATSEDINMIDSTGEERAALSELKGRGKHKTVGTIRTGDVRKATRGGLSMMKPAPQQKSSQPFQVFRDENAPPPSSLPPQTGEWTTVPTPSSINRENDKKPGVWTNGKVSQRTTGVVPIAAVSSYNRPSFTVHADENMEHKMTTPLKPPEFGNNGLSARKQVKEPTPIEQFSKPFQSDPSLVPMYRKDQVYRGVDEYQFEEIRAAKWMACKRDRERKEEEKRLQEQKAEFEAQMQQQMEMLRREKMEIERTRNNFMAQVQQNMDALRAERDVSLRSVSGSVHNTSESVVNSSGNLGNTSGSVENTSTSSAEPHVTSAGNITLRRSGPIPAVPHYAASTSLQHHPYRQNSSELTLSKQLEFGVTQPKSNAVNASQNLTQPANPQHKTVEAALSERSNINNSSMHTPNMSGCVQNTTHSGASSGKSLGRSGSMSHTPDSGPGGFGRLGKHTPTRTSMAPSPTVNMKQALEAVMGMFTDGQQLEQQFGWSQPATKPGTMDTSGPGNGGVFGGGGAPFQIFSETTEDSSKKSLHVPRSTAKEENDENRAPADYKQPVKRKPLAGISQPSSEILHQAEQETAPSEPQEENMDGIEFSYAHRDDITLAPLGSALEFAAAAKLASTPFNPLGECGEPVERSQPRGRNILGGDVGEKSAHEGPSESGSLQEAPESYIDGVAKQEKSGLSPILELSEEDGKSTTANANGGTRGGNHTNHASHLETVPEQKCLVPSQDGRVSPSQSMCNQSYHIIDTSGYFPNVEQPDDILSMSIAIDPRDPFDEIAIQGFLTGLSTPISEYTGYHKMEGRMPKANVGSLLKFGDKQCTVEKKLGEGGFASVYCLSVVDEADPGCVAEDNYCVMKVQRPPCPWEFYICCTIQKRLAAKESQIDVSSSMMKINQAYFFDDGSCLLNKLHVNGTLLDLVNVYRGSTINLSQLEPVATYITIELLTIIQHLHSCQIIHGDIKPDNFLVKEIVSLHDDCDTVLGSETRMLKLIDFGQSIDMTMYPPGTNFTAKVHTSGFQCIEMKTDKPWTYQTDLFGLIGTIHVVIFGEYMNIFQSDGKWKVTSHIPRAWNSKLWNELFNSLLNIPSCKELPDLTYFIREFEQMFLKSMIPKYNQLRRKLQVKMVG